MTDILAAASPAASAPASAAAKEHLGYLDSFRALAIVLIVAGHAFDLAWMRSGSISDAPGAGFLSAIVNGSTFYFVFISGFLYRHVFYGRMPFTTFMRKKAIAVGVPYLVLGLVLSLLQIWIAGFHVTLEKHGAFLGANVYVDVMTQIVTGQMMTAYWYIPFIFVVFAASPLFDRFIEARRSTQVLVWLAALLVSLWVHRPYENLNPFHAALYFGHVYLAGILFWQVRKPLMAALMRAPILLATAAMVMAMALYQDLVVANVNTLERSAGDGWLPLGFDWVVVQKYAGVLFFCGVLARLPARLERRLGFVAENSFGIYFLHGIVLAALSHAPVGWLPHSGIPTLDLIGYAAIVFLGSLAAVLTIKALLGFRSRYVIGA